MANNQQNQNQPSVKQLNATISAREHQLTKAIDSEYRTLVQFFSLRTDAEELKAQLISAEKELAATKEQLSLAKADLVRAHDLSNALSWFIENLALELPEFPNYKVDDSSRERILAEFLNFKSGEKHLANIALVKNALQVDPEPSDDAPAAESTPEPETEPELEPKTEQLTSSLTNSVKIKHAKKPVDR